MTDNNTTTRTSAKQRILDACAAMSERMISCEVTETLWPNDEPTVTARAADREECFSSRAEAARWLEEANRWM